MSNILELKSLQWEEEPDKLLKHSKKRVLSNFKMSTERTQSALMELVQDLFTYNRIAEMHEVCEYVLRQPKIDSRFFPTLYAYYLYSRRENQKDELYKKAESFFLEMEVPRRKDAFDTHERILKELRSSGWVKIEDSIIGRLHGIMRVAVRHLAFRHQKVFPEKILEKKITKRPFRPQSHAQNRSIKLITGGFRHRGWENLCPQNSSVICLAKY